MVTRYKKDGTRAKQPGPRPGKGLRRPPPPEHPTNQRSVRFDRAMLDACDKYAFELTGRTGIHTNFSDLVKRGLRLVLAEPLPPMPIVSGCNLVPIELSLPKPPVEAHCFECMQVVRLDGTCPRTGLRPGATVRED